MKSNCFRPEIQGLRAVAVIAVMAFHLNPAWLPGGFVGVDVFLVISGFLITSILLDRRSRPEYSTLDTLKYFYISRIKRIAPAYFTMLLIVALISAVFLLPQDFKVFKKGLAQAVLFTSNNYFADFGDYFSPASYEQPLLHTWSLAVEIQFYLISPFLILLLPRKLLKWVFVGSFVGLTIIAEYRLHFLGIEQATYYSLYARLPEFFAGALVALYVTTGGKMPSWISVLGLGMIGLAIVFQPSLGTFPGIAALLPVTGAVMLLSQSAPGKLVGVLLGSKIFVWVGALSYSLYLWHWPVLALLRYYTGNEVLNFEFSLLFIALTVVLAGVSYYLVEQAFRGRRTSKKQIIGWGLLSFGVLATSLSMAKINLLLSPDKLPIEYRRYADPSTICHGKIIGDCLKGDLSSEKEVLVLGDSHAAMLNIFFDYVGKELGFKARIITASSCVTIPGFDYQRIPGWAQKACLKQIEEAAKYLDTVDTVFLAASWNWHLESKEFKQALTEFLQEDAWEASKYIVSQEPLLNRHPFRGQRFNYLGLEVKTMINKDYLRTNQVLEELAQVSNKTSFLSLDELEIFKKAPVYKGNLIYIDEHHLNEVGVIEYAEQAVEIINKVIDSD